MSLSTKCPACGKVLKLKTEAAVGRKVPCPGCKEPFVVTLRKSPKKPAPVEEEYAEDEYGTEEYGDYDYGDDEYGDYEEAGYEEYETPARSSKGSSKSASAKKSKKKKQGGPAWLMPVLMGGGALVALGLVATVVTFAISNMGDGAANVVDLSYQPADCEAFIIARPAAMANSPLAAAVMNVPLVKQFAELQKAQA